MKTIHKEEGYPLAFFETYLAMIFGSVESNQYRHLYVRTRSGPEDVIGNGDLACAYFVSSILTLFRLTKGRVHTTVNETIRDLEMSGWKKIPSPRPGCIVVWGKKLRRRGPGHRHIGFFVGDDSVVSNNAALGSPKLHLLFERDDLGRPIRKVESYYSHPRLESTFS